MEPISAMIGGVASIAGAAMNTSSAQAINAAQMQNAALNRQFQIDQTRGQYLPEYYKNLVYAGNQAGLNPLALIGAHVPGGSGSNVTLSQTDPGRGLMEFGRNIAQLDLEKREVDLQKGKEEVEHQAALTKQTNIDNATKLKVLDDLNKGKIVSGPEPSVNQPGGFIVEGLKRFWEKPTDFGDSVRYRPSEPVTPEYDWNKYKPRTFQERFFGGGD